VALADPSSRTGRTVVADRVPTVGRARLSAVVWLPALAVFAVGWQLRQGDGNSPVAVVALQAPLVAALVLTVEQMHRQRPRRVVWALVSLALVLATVSGVLFGVYELSGGTVLRASGVVSGVLAELGLAAAALVLVRRGRVRLPAGWLLDLAVVAAGGVTYAVLVHQQAGPVSGMALLSLGELALGMALIGVLVQLIVGGPAREPFVALLVGAMALRQVTLVEQTLALREDPPVPPSLWLDPAWAGLGFALTMAVLVWASQDLPGRRVPARSGPDRAASGRGRAGRAVAGPALGWVVPAASMALAAAVLVWFARFDGPRPGALVAWAGVTVVLGLVRAAYAGRHLERLDRSGPADTDDVSGLLSRRGATDALAEACRRGPGSVLVIDIDRFRDVNQYLGLQAADEVLRQLGERLAGGLVEGETLGRLGADEFVLIGPAATPAAALARARQVRSLVEFPFPVGEDRVRVDISVGVALWDSRPPSVGHLLGQAHQARLRARERGTAVERWDPERDALGARRLALAASLRTSVRREELVLHYQPQVDTTSGKVVGVEALARWTHDGEPVPPDLFIPMAEEAGLITELTRSLLDQALAQLARWDRDGLMLSMAVNLSPRNLVDPALPRRVARLLERHRVAPGRLVLEITETTRIPDSHRAGEVLDRLRRMGVRLSIDDYGTGHAALTYLRDFAVDELKLDRTYVAAMLDDERTMAIVQSTVSMGRRLGLEVVAEGVERAEQIKALARCGCHIVQGYLVCRPRPAEELTAWLHQRAAVTPLRRSPR